MTPIIRALALGYAAPQILDFVSRAFPALTGRIKKAKSSGYSVDQILKIINQGMGGDSNLPTTEAEVQNKRDVRREEIGKDLLTLGAGSLGTLAASKALPGFVNSLKGSLGPSSSVGAELVGEALQPKSDIPISTPPISPVQPPPLPQQLQQQEPQQQVQAAQIVPQSSAQQPPQLDSASILADLGLDEKANNLLAQGKTPEQVSREIVGGLNPKQRKAFTEKVGKGEIPPTLDAVIKDYAGKVQPLDIQKQSLPKVKKGDFVATNQGVLGEIESERNGKALIKDTSGKMHQVDMADVLPEPEETKDIDYDKIVDELENNIIKASEEYVEGRKKTPFDLSTAMDLTFHDPVSNAAFFIFPDSPNMIGIYQNVPAEMYEKIKLGMGTPTTKGETGLGRYKPSVSDSRGSELKALRADPVKYPYHKVEIPYNAAAPFFEAMKRLNQKWRKQESERKKTRKRKQSLKSCSQ